MAFRFGFLRGRLSRLSRRRAGGAERAVADNGDEVGGVQAKEGHAEPPAEPQALLQ